MTDQPARDPYRFLLLSLSVTTVLLLSLALPAAAHQCVDVTLTSSPSSASAGDPIAVAGTVRNCGDPASAFSVSWILTGEGRRLQLASKLVSADPGETVAISETLFLPSNLPDGDYTLTLRGEAPSGFTDTDSAPLTVE